MAAKMRFITGFLLFLPAFLSGFQLVSNYDMKSQDRQFSGSKYIKAIVVFRGIVYFGTANGLVYYHPGKGKWAVYSSKNTPLKSNYISSLAVDRKRNHLWIATGEGVARYAPLEKEVFNRWKIFKKRDGLADNETTAIAVDDEYVWVGTRFWGISRYDKALNRWRAKPFTPIDGLGANRIYGIVIDGKQVWAATDDGLSLYDRYSELWSNFDAKQGLSAKQVTCLSSDGKGIWAGTYGGGLNYFDKDTMKFKVYRTTDGLADDTVYAVRCDGNSVWAATFGGLSRYVRGDTIPWKNYSQGSHKLIDNETTAIGVQGNLLWVGTDGKGITLFDKKTPQVVLTGDTAYIKPGRLGVSALIKDAYPIVSYKVSYRASLFTTRQPTTAGVRLVNSGKVRGRKSAVNIRIAEIDLSKLRDNFTYDLILDVVNTRGVRNSTVFPFTVDKTKPVLTVDELPQAVKDREIFVRGGFLELYPDTIAVSVNGSRFVKAGEMDRKGRRFSHKIQLRPGENVIRIRIIDLGKNRVTVTKKLIYDPDKPILLFSDEVKKGVSSTPQFTISGRVKEANMNSLYLMPGKIRINWKKDSDDIWKFEKKVSLIKGTNAFEVVAVDDAGSRSAQKLILLYNTDAPSLTFDPSMAAVVASRFYTVKGSWDDKDLREIIVNPGNVKATIDRKKKTYWAKINLKDDLTRIKVTAYDAENNQKTISKTVSVDENMTGKNGIKTTIHDARENYRLYIKYKKMYDDLLVRYKKLLLKYEALEKRCAGRRQGRGAGGGLYIPAGQSVFFAPYNRRGGDTMEGLAQTYLKDPAGKRIIAGFNNGTPATLLKRRGRLLIPTASLVRHLFTVSYRSASWALIDTVSEAFNTIGPGRAFYTYKRAIIARLRAHGMLTGKVNPADGILPIRGKGLLLLHSGGGLGLSRRRLQLKMKRNGARFGYIVTFHGSHLRFFRVQ